MLFCVTTKNKQTRLLTTVSINFCITYNPIIGLLQTFDKPHLFKVLKGLSKKILHFSMIIAF